MGVRGLFSFFQNSHNFFVETELQNSLVVIDGNNLRYHLFITSPQKNCCFGGDYEKYYKHVLKFFQNLVECDLRPIVVIDGSFGEAKRRTLWQRARDQIQAAVRCTPEGSLTVLPLLAKEVFLRAVKDVKEVDLIQDIYEADSKIAQIASSLKCPVLSNDSDFFVFNVEVISLRCLTFAKAEENSILRCQSFDRRAFLKYFGIENRDMLFLLASLMGNDYVSGKVFEKVFSQIR